MDLNNVLKLFEGSPVVIVLLIVVYYMWKNVQRKDAMLLELQRETLITMRDNTQQLQQNTEATKKLTDLMARKSPVRQSPVAV